MHPTEKNIPSRFSFTNVYLNKKQTAGALPDFYMIFQEAKGK